MCRFRCLFVMTLVSCFATGLRASEPAPLADKKVRAQVELFYAAWSAAFAKKDLATLMDMYHPAMKYSMQGQPDQNLRQLRAAWAEDFAARPKSATWRPRIEEMYADRSLIVVVGIWETTEKAADGQSFTFRIRSIDVLTTSSGALQILHTVNYPIQ